MPDLPERRKGVTPCCSHLVMGYVLWTVCTSFKLNSMICVKVARRHSACFEILRKGGAQLRRLVSHFHPRLCCSAPTPPPRSYASSGLGSQASGVAVPRRWLLGGVTERPRAGRAESRLLPAGTQAFGHLCSLLSPSFLS